MSGERIAEVLGEHQVTSKLLSPSDVRTACLCGAYAQDDELPTYGNAWSIAHQAAMLAPVIVAAQAEARAEALAEVAEDALEGLRQFCPDELRAIGFMSGYAEAARDNLDRTTT